MKAYEKITEERLYLRWSMNYDQTCSFDDFKNKLIESKSKFRGIEKSTDEILEDVKSILDSASKEEAQ